MWESPVNIILTQMHNEFEGQVMNAIQKVGVIVDKEELVKAINYDREQYEKGFNDGVEYGIDIFMNKALEMIKSEQDTRYGYLDGADIREIARELKGGVKNG